MNQRFNGEPVSSDEQGALAAGFIAGLRSRFGFSDTEFALVAYVYALMNGERNGALALSDKLLIDESGLQFSSAGYLHGLKAARTLLGDYHFVASTSVGIPVDNGVAFESGGGPTDNEFATVPPTRIN